MQKLYKFQIQATGRHDWVDCDSQTLTDDQVAESRAKADELNMMSDALGLGSKFRVVAADGSDAKMTA